MAGPPAFGPTDEILAPTEPSSAAQSNAAASPSLRRNSVARLVADSYGLITAFVIAAITARLLGPAGKGFYSSLILLTGIFVNCFSAGMGESAIVLLGRRRAELRDAAPATVTAAAALGVAGAVTLFLAARLVLHPDTHNEDMAIAFASVLVLFHVPSLMMIAFLNSMERIVAVAALLMIYSTVATVVLWALTSMTHLGTAGAVLGNMTGNAAMLIGILALLRRAEVPLRPRWRPGYLRDALRFGAALQLSNLLVLVTGRLDLLFVYRIRDPASAGRYSIALTVGMLVGTMPLALAYASFPRLANLEDGPARALTAQVFRVGMVVAAAAASVLGFLTPVAVPLLFGSAYRGAIGPSLVLVAGGVFWSAQWLLSRASAARGAPAALCASFATSFSVMVLLDLILIGPYGEMGAAVAAFASAVAGLAVAASFYRGQGWDWRNFLPRRGDARLLLSVGFDPVRGVIKRRSATATSRLG